jgi:hypothetical protein
VILLIEKIREVLSPIGLRLLGFAAIGESGNVPAGVLTVLPVLLVRMR